MNTLNRKGKRKRNRQTGTFGSRPDTKRAIVTLAERRPHRPVRGLDATWHFASASPPAPAVGSRRSPTSRRSPRPTPEKSLLAPKPNTGGRNSYGRKTARHKGGGHKQQYRIIDFKRTKDGVPAKVAAIEYDPNRNCRIAAAPLPRRREALHPRPEAT